MHMKQASVGDVLELLTDKGTEVPSRRSGARKAGTSCSTVSRSATPGMIKIRKTK